MMRASSLHALFSISFLTAFLLFSSSSFLVCFCVFIPSPPPTPIPPSFPAFLGRPGHQAQQRTAECRCGCRCRCDTPVAPERPAASVGISSQMPSAPALFTQTPRLLINMFPQSQVSQAYRTSREQSSRWKGMWGDGTVIDLQIYGSQKVEGEWGQSELLHFISFVNACRC